MKYIEKTAVELEALYNDANEAYYNDGEPIISDADFNELEFEMKRRGISTESISKGKYGEEVEHTTICPSLRKVNVKGEFNKGHHSEIIKALSKSPVFRKGSVYTLHYKLDGLAINAMYEGGKLISAATRGDYKVGRNVINKIRQLLPQTVKSTITEIRFECVIPVDVFKNKYAEEYSHPRNLASGILNDESIDDYRKNDLKLIPLNGVEDNMFVNQVCVDVNLDSLLSPLRLTYEELNNFDDFKHYFNVMKSVRGSVNETYPTDGLVISPIKAMVNDTDGVKYPNHSLSIKFPPSSSKAIVKGITWNLKKSGEYVPVVNLHPVKIDGRMISKTHGFNYGFIKTNKIESGAEVEIEIAGDIIPYLSSVTKPSIEPIIYPEEGIIDGCHCYSNDADAIKVEKFIHSAIKLELKGFGESFYRSVSSYYEHNVFNIFDREQFTNEEGLKELGLTLKTLDKFITSVMGKKSITLKDIVVLMAVDNCGDGTSTEVAKYLGSELFKLDRTKYDVDHDFARKQKDVVKSFVSGENYTLVEDIVNSLESQGVTVLKADEKKEDVGDIISFVMTGSPKGSTDFNTKGAFKKSLPSNYIEVKSLTKANLLITDKLESKTTKMKDAAKRGIEIKTYESFTESDTFIF